MATDLLTKAFEKLSALPDYEQDAIAENLIAWIEAHARQWDAVFARSPEKLDKLAERVHAEYLAGRTEPLDPDKL